MKKLTSVAMLLVLLFVMFFPSTSLALGLGNTSDLVTNAKQTSEKYFSFTVNGAKYSSVSYKISLCTSSSRSSTFPLPGKLVTLGTTSKKVTISVMTPVMGTYVIESSAGSKKDIDYITVNYKTTIYSEKIKWTQSKIDKFNDKKEIAMLACGIVSFALTFTPVSIAGAYLGLSCTLYAGGNYVFQRYSSTRYINVAPKLNYSWQYKFVPNSNGYTTYLLVFNTKGNLERTYNLGTEVLN